MSAVVTASAPTSCGSVVREYRAVGREIETGGLGAAVGPAHRRPTAVTPRSVRPLFRA
jgi:hypothetical protein